MAEVVTVILYGAEGYSTESVYFEDVLGSRGGGDDEDIGFFTDADLVAGAIEGFAFHVGVERKVVEATVGEAVSVI